MSKQEIIKQFFCFKCSVVPFAFIGDFKLKSSKHLLIALLRQNKNAKK